MEYETINITKKELDNINEDNVMFITNPGRMGDTDGITFITYDKEFIIYRVDGLIFDNKPGDITMDDMLHKFPKWFDAWKNDGNENYKGKYKYFYLGFGNGLAIDNSIYDKYKPYLDKEVDKYLENEEYKEGLEGVAIYNVWEQAFIDMVEDER